MQRCCRRGTPRRQNQAGRKAAEQKRQQNENKESILGKVRNNTGGKVVSAVSDGPRPLNAKMALTSCGVGGFSPSYCTR